MLVMGRHKYALFLSLSLFLLHERKKKEENQRGRKEGKKSSSFLLLSGHFFLTSSFRLTTKNDQPFSPYSSNLLSLSAYLFFSLSLHTYFSLFLLQEKRKFFAGSFIGSIVWIAFFSYLMVWWATLGLYFAFHILSFFLFLPLFLLLHLLFIFFFEIDPTFNFLPVNLFFLSLSFLSLLSPLFYFSLTLFYLLLHPFFIQSFDIEILSLALVT